MELGITIRDYFAANAMQGLCANSYVQQGLADLISRGGSTAEIARKDLAETAYQMADTMLEVK